VVAADQQQPQAPEEAASGALKPDFTADELLDHVPAEIRNPSFAVGVRGYDRGAVEAYVKRVNRVIAELEVGRSPQAAVRHALDRVGQQTIAVLQEARDSADKLMAAAREEGEEARARAKEEAAKLVVNASAEADQARVEAEQLLANAREEAAEILGRARADADERLKEAQAEIKGLREDADTRKREIESDTQIVLHHRQQLLDEVERMAAQLQELARAAAGRVVEEPAAATAEPADADGEMVTLAEGNQPSSSTTR
jgi:DivIVA domain-containing protein